jgi:hypothetical protein
MLAMFRLLSAEDDIHLDEICCSITGLRVAVKCYPHCASTDAIGVLDPCKEPFGSHVEVLDDGTIQGRTPQGVVLVSICRLDRPKLTAFRRGMLTLWRTLAQRQELEAAALRHRFFGLPANLPYLSVLRPPRGNTRPQGIEGSYFARQQRGELPSMD